MRLKRLRWRLPLLFGLVPAALAIAPLLMWSRGEADAIRNEFSGGLTYQMELVQRSLITGDKSDVDFPAWLVNGVDGWVEPLSETDLEPPLLTWAREVEDDPSMRTFSQDDAKFEAYIRPTINGAALVTVNWTGDRDDSLAALNRRTLLSVLGLLAVSFGLGWLASGLALGPTRRLIDDQQEFLADAAHEMRTPLAVIMASSSQALNRQRSSEEYVRSLSEIRSAAERASTGVNELLDLVRFDSGQAIPRLAPLRLDLLAEEVAASVRADDCTVIAEPGPPVVVNADLALVRQALDNIVRNAVRRSDRVELNSRLEGRMGVIEVGDNGPGFDVDVLPRIFDRYQRGDRRGEVGIGLAIVKAIIDANGGSVEATNRDGGSGALVTVRLPLMTS